MVMGKVGDEMDARDTKVDENGSREKANIRALNILANPTAKELLSLTNIPLRQVNTLAWELAYDKYAKQLVDRAEKRNEKKYYQKLVSKAVEFNNSEEAEKWQKKVDAVEIPKMELLSEIWIDYYCRLRQSIDGENKTHFVTITRDQIQSQGEIESEPMLPHISR